MKTTTINLRKEKDLQGNTIYKADHPDYNYTFSIERVGPNRWHLTDDGVNNYGYFHSKQEAVNKLEEIFSEI